jgi:hypothetical protein
LVKKLSKFAFTTDNLPVKPFAGMSWNSAKDDHHWFFRSFCLLPCGFKVVVNPRVILREIRLVLAHGSIAFVLCVLSAGDFGVEEGDSDGQNKKSFHDRNPAKGLGELEEPKL